MSFDAEEFARYQIANAPMLRHPFPHFFVRPIFPEEYYAELRRNLPPLEWMKPIEAYPGRYMVDVADVEEREQAAGTGSFWLQLSQWLTSDRFRSLVLEKFRLDIGQRFGPQARLVTDIDARLVRDFTTYAIGPHTDAPRKLVSLLFYLPKDEALSPHGTSIYAHTDPSFRCEGRLHHAFDGFKRVAGMPFVPNSLFAFMKTDYSFHGVEPIAQADVERDLLLYNIYVRAVQPAGRGLFSFRPWRR